MEFPLLVSEIYVVYCCCLQDGRAKRLMKITSKGQVTIPVAIRKKARLLPHCEVEFRIEGENVVIRKIKQRVGRGQALIAALRGKGSVKMSTDRILALTRGRT